MKKSNLLHIFLLSMLILSSMLLVSCADSDVKNDKNFASKPNYYEEEEISSEDTSFDDDPQYSMGLNGMDSNSSYGDNSTVEKTPVYVPEVTVNAYMLTKRSVKLNVAYLPQKPELPTGCEITALTMVLNYHGYNVSKTDMADNYLPKSDTSKNFRMYFIGNPRYTSSFGCYAQPITDAANNYLNEQNSGLVAYNYSGVEFEKLLLQVENGNPVVIWGTLDMAEPYYSYEWIIEDGSKLRWITPEHCLVLIGYDLDRNVAIMSDPMRGIVEYDLTTVKSRYIALHTQCVVIF